jgi:ribosomal protein S18 acetylase RimI-like enzyme
MHFREGIEQDVQALVKLYKAVALFEGGIARLENEITEEYVKIFVSKSIRSGSIIVCEHPEEPGVLVGEIHAYKSGLSVFDHVLTDLTAVVHPEFQGKKVGRTMFTIFLNEIVQSRPDIGKVELITRESNRKAIALYESLGFRIEGRLEMRIKTTAKTYEADIPMGWQNPNYQFE